MRPTRRVRTRRTVRLQRPTLTVRPAQESVRLWSRRRTTFTLLTVGWFVLAGVFWSTRGGWLVLSLCLAAALLSSATAWKAHVTLSRAHLPD